MEKIATDIYTFSELRRHGFTYVDKTGVLLPLVDMSMGKQFFIARRTCGYIGSQFWNQGRTQEIKERVLHVS